MTKYGDMERQQRFAKNNFKNDLTLYHALLSLFYIYLNSNLNKIVQNDKHVPFHVNPNQQQQAKGHSVGHLVSISTQ